MNYLMIIIPAILYLLLLCLGTFIIIQNPKRKVLLMLGGSFLCGALYIFGTVLARLEFSLQGVVFWYKFLFVPAELSMLLWLLASLEFAKELKCGFSPNKNIIYVFVVLNFISTFLLVFTNFFVEYQHPIHLQDKYLGWDFPTSKFFLLRSLLILIDTLIPVINYFMFTITGISRDIKRFGKVMLISSVLVLLGTTFSSIQFFLRTRISFIYKFPEIIQEILIIPAMFLIAFVILNPKLIIKEMLGVVNDFLSHIGYSLLILIPYTLLILISFSLFKEKELLLTVLFCIIGLVVITHSTQEWVIETIKRLFRDHKFSFPAVLPSEVNSALKFYSIPMKLEKNALLRLKLVDMVASKKHISKTEALREVLRNEINSFEPKGGSFKRTSSRLKYEILKQITFEEATETQIMWDLGFDVYTRSIEEKLRTYSEPRFRLKNASEYSATSTRSFKRLRKEAIESLACKLEELERQVKS